MRILGRVALNDLTTSGGDHKSLSSLLLLLLLLLLKEYFYVKISVGINTLRNTVSVEFYQAFFFRANTSERITFERTKRTK